MSVSTVRRDAVALATYLRHGVLGFRNNLLFSNSGEDAVTLSGDPGQPQGDQGEVLDVQCNDVTREFVIAKQTNFPPSTGIREGAEITFPVTGTTYAWSVQSWQAEGEASDGIAAVYRVTAKREQPMTLGVTEA